MTVALPVFRAEKVIWLALESLKNQININFGWELIIWEEFGKSKNIVKNFIGKLPGCQRIMYKALKNKILLISKWIGIANSASSTSKIYVLQAADDYSPPKRLSIHYQHFRNPKCYFSTQLKGLFYNLRDGRKIFYIGQNSKKNHLNMAYKIKVIKLIKNINIYDNVDHYIKKCVDNILRSDKNKIIMHDLIVDKNNWKYGFFTDGYNTISVDRKKYYSYPTEVFFNSFVKFFP